MDCLIPKPSFLKNVSDAIKPIAGGIRGALSFPNAICPKVSVIAQLEIELAY